MAKPASGTALNADALVTNLEAAWGMLEGSGTTSADSTGNGHGLTLASGGGAPTWSTNGSSEAIIAMGTALQQPLAVTAGSFLIGGSNASWSLAFRAKQTSSGNNGMVIGDQSSNASFVWFVGGSFLRVRDDNSVDHDFSSLTTFTSDANYLLVYDGTADELHLYKDGAEVSGSPKTSVTSCPLRIDSIGNAYSSSALALIGNVTYAYVWTTRALTSTDAANLNTNPYRFFDAPPADTITLTDVTDNKVIQRSGTTGSLTIAGTYTGTPTSIQARVVLDGTSTEVVTWTTIVASPSGGTFSGTLTGITQGSWYNVQVRFSNDTGVVSNGVNQFGVGCLFAPCGQSQGVKWFDTGTDLTPDSRAVKYVSGTYSLMTSTGNGANQFANSMRGFLGTTIPVCLLPLAVGATALNSAADGGAGYWINTASGQPYDLFEDGVIASGGKLEGVIWIQGEQDGYSTVVSESTYASDLATLFSRMRTAFGQASLPIVITPLGRYLAAGPTDASWEGICRAQITAGASSNNALASFNKDLALQGDNVHFTAGALTTHGKRAARAMAFLLGLSSYARGPSIASATLASSTTVEVNLTHRGGTDFTPTSGITGFVLLDNGTPATISGAVRTNATKITLTASATLTGPVTLRHQYGAAPTVTSPVVDNSTDALSLGLESAATIAVTSTQTVTPGLLTNSQTFYTATVSPGQVTVAPGLFTNSQTFYTASIANLSGSQSIAPGLLTNSQTFYTASIANLSGTQSITPGLLTNSQTFYAPTVTPGGVSIAPNLVANVQSFYAPTVSDGVTPVFSDVFPNNIGRLIPVESRIGSRASAVVGGRIGLGNS